MRASLIHIAQVVPEHRQWLMQMVVILVRLCVSYWRMVFFGTYHDLKQQIQLKTNAESRQREIFRMEGKDGSEFFKRFCFGPILTDEMRQAFVQANGIRFFEPKRPVSAYDPGFMRKWFGCC